MRAHAFSDGCWIRDVELNSEWLTRYSSTGERGDMPNSFLLRLFT